MKPRPLWELLDKSLTPQQQREESRKSDQEWQQTQLSNPANIFSFLPRIYIVFTHYAQLQLFREFSFPNLCIGLLMWLFTSHFCQSQKTTPLPIYPIDIFIVVISTFILVPLLPLIFSQVKTIENFTIPATIVYVIFGAEREDGESPIGLAEMVMIAAVMLQDSKIGEIQLGIIFVNLSIGLIVWKPWKLIMTSPFKEKYNFGIILTTGMILAMLSCKIALGFLCSVLLAIMVCLLAKYLRSYQLKYAKKWELPEVNSYS